MKTLQKLVEVKETEITDITTTNIEKVIINTVNKNSFIVSSVNEITYENVKFVGVKGTVEITQNNNACVVMDQQFSDELTQNITITTVTSFYDEIVNNLNEESLQYIESSIKEQYPDSNFGVKDFEEVEDKTYINILNRINNVIENSSIANIINEQIANSQQFNILNVKDAQFGSANDGSLTEEEYNERKANLKVVNKQTNTTNLLMKNIVKNLGVTNLLNNVVTDLQNFEDSSITYETKEEETEKTGDEQDQQDQKEQEEEQKKQDDQQNNKQNDEQQKNNTKTKKIIFYSVLGLVILIILIILILLIKKLKK